MADVLEKLISDSNLRNRFGLNGKSKFEKFYGVEKMAREYEKIYFRSLGID